MGIRLAALLLGIALPSLALAQSPGPTPFLQGQTVTYSQLNKNFNSVVKLNGLSMVGACSGNSSPNGIGQATITVTCPGAGQPQGPNGAIQLNNGGLFSGVVMSGDGTLGPTGILTLNTVPVTEGGTGATSAAVARTNLGISTVGATGAYTDLTGLPTLGTIASQAIPAGPFVGSSGSSLISIPAMTGDGSWNTTTGAFTLNLLGVPKGGTGASIFSAHQLLLGQGASPFTTTTGGTSGQVLTSNGPNTDPTWQASAGGGGSGLTAITNNTLLANTSGFSAVPVSTTPSVLLDAIGATRGSLLERGATGWTPIVPGVSGSCLTSNGSNADPTWQTSCGGSSFGGTGGVVGVDANGTPFVFSLNNLTVSLGSGSGILSAGTGGGGSGGGGGGSEPVNAQTGTTYTVVSADATGLTTLNNASTIAVTLPQPGTTILGGWYADYSVIGAGPATFTPTSSTVDGASSLTLYPGQGIRIVSDGTNYFTQRGGMSPAQIGPLINVLSTSGAVADSDTFPSVQGGSAATKQSMGAVWTWVSGHIPNFQAPQVISAANFTLDANTHNGKLVTVTSPITISLPSTLAGVGVGFRTAIFNQSGGAITLSNAGASWGSWATSSGSLSIPNGQVAMVSVIQPSSAVVYAAISNTGGGAGSGAATAFPRVSGRYYAPNVNSVAAAAVTANRLYALPIRLAAATYRGLAFAVQAAATGSNVTCRMGLYADSGGNPGALLKENVVTVTVGTIGNQYSDFTAGDYTAAAEANAWVAIICGANTGMTALVEQSTAQIGKLQTDELGLSSSLGGSPGVSGDVGIYSATITTLPATLAGANSGNFGTSTYTNLNIPIVNIRAR